MASYDEVVPPGGRGSVRAAIRTDELRGYVERAVHLRTNDPEHPELDLAVAVRVQGSVLLLPHAGVHLGLGRRLKREATLVVRKDPTESGVLEIEEVRTSAPWLTARAEPQGGGVDSGDPAAEPGSWRILVRLAPEAPPGTHRETVRFITGLPREPEVTVPVTVQVPPPLAFQPTRLTLRGDATEGGGEVFVSVRDPDAAGNLEAVSVPTGAFDLSLERRGPRHFSLRVRLAGDAKARKGAVRLRLGAYTADIPVEILAERDPGKDESRPGPTAKDPRH